MMVLDYLNAALERNTESSQASSDVVINDLEFHVVL